MIIIRSTYVSPDISLAAGLIQHIATGLMWHNDGLI